MMDAMYEQNALLSAEMDEVGLRPLNWIDTNKDFGGVINDFNSKESASGLTAYPVELQFSNNFKNITTNENHAPLTNDENYNAYDIDPETGEKVFRQSVFASTASASNEQWVDNYVDNILTLSDQDFGSIMTDSNGDLFLDNFPASLFGYTEDHGDLDFFSSILNSNENGEQDVFTNPVALNINNQDQSTSNEVTPVTTAPMLDCATVPTQNTTDVSTMALVNPLSVAVDDEYSNYSDMSLSDTKMEEVDIDRETTVSSVPKRTSGRTNYQGQQDEDVLQQYHVPLTLNDIIQSSTDKYNRLLAQLSNLSSEQMNIIKDIRRRGKNKIAAQNCRKRKANDVDLLMEEVDDLKRVKQGLEERKKAILQQIAEIRSQYEYLHQQVLPNRQLPPAIVVQ